MTRPGRCEDCGADGIVHALGRCSPCYWRHHNALGRATCPGCRSLRLLTDTGLCRVCQRWANHQRVPPVPRPCLQCGEVRLHAGHGLCSRCYQRRQDMPLVLAGGLQRRLAEAPEWLGAFAEALSTTRNPGRATVLLTQLGRLLTAHPHATPAALLELSRTPGRSVGSLARSLEDFFVDQQLTFRPDHAARLAAGRRARRVAATPEPLRPALSRFADRELANRERCRRNGTRFRADSTVEAGLSVLRDLAQYLFSQDINDWALVAAGHVEGFLNTPTSMRPHRLTVLRRFFRWARGERLILTDPTRGLHRQSQAGFTGEVLTVERQRELLHRWATGAGHPNENVFGLLALLHAASSSEVAAITVENIDGRKRAVQLGDRPWPVVLDPLTWAAVQACLSHRNALRTANQHLLVTTSTRTRRTRASSAYLSHLLDPAGVNPMRCRLTRLVDMVGQHDPKVFTVALGVSDTALIRYQGDGG